MAEPNAKVVIKELDLTTPQGSGVGSDVVYIPGLASSEPVKITEENGETITEYAPVHQPILCNTVAEFEAAFGKNPYWYTALDVMDDDLNMESYSDSFKLSTMYEVGNPDKSYVYAKELLNAGISVLYENFNEHDASTKLQNVAIVDTFPSSEENNTYALENNENNSYVLNKVSGYPVVIKSTEENTPDTIVGFNQTFMFTIPPFTPRIDNVSFIEFCIPSQVFSSYHMTVKPVGVNYYLGKKQYTTLFAEGATLPDNSTDAGATYYVAGPTNDGVTVVRIPITNTVFSNKQYLENLVFYVDVSFVPDSVVGSDALLETLPTNKLVSIPFNTYVYRSVNGDDIITDAGMNGETVQGSSKIGQLYRNLPSALERLKDKSLYSVKYITSGGYPSFLPVVDTSGRTYPLAQALINCAKYRQDAVALIDHIEDKELTLDSTDDKSIYKQLIDSGLTAKGSGEFGAMFTPWGLYTCPYAIDSNRSLVNITLPASFGYLLCLANTIKTQPNWLAIAGVSRGVVPGLVGLMTPRGQLNNTIAETYQPKYGAEGNNASINAITDIRPYGLTIWGNRTLLDVDPKGTVALNFLNTRNMVSDIKKLAYDTARSLMFEQDSDTLWLRFKSKITPFLEQLKSGAGISDYKIYRTSVKTDGTLVTRGELAAVIQIAPIAAIEYFDITVTLVDQEVSVSE